MSFVYFGEKKKKTELRDPLCYVTETELITNLRMSSETGSLSLDIQTNWWCGKYDRHPRTR